MKKNINKNCWLVKTLNDLPAKRCKYCRLKFRDCLFSQYILISFILAILFMILSYIFKGEISKLLIISLFTLILVYGYFFNKSTNEIIKANFNQKKANEDLKKLSENLQKKVKEKTKDLEKSYKELKSLSKAKSEFISIASHQLRTPIAAIKGYVSMILEGRFGRISKTAEKKMKRVFSSLERLNILINTLLDLSRVESGKIKLNMKKKSLEKIIKNVINELEYNAENKNISIEFKKSKKKIPKILLDKEKIKESIVNIIDNAIKYTDKGKVIVLLEKKKSSVLIKITDTGTGMTQKEIKSLFVSFVRGPGGKILNTEGTGLGLYISKKFINLHKGKIWAESEGRDRGSTFYVELPIK